jgi:hypothetical protein
MMSKGAFHGGTRLSFLQSAILLKLRDGFYPLHGNIPSLPTRVELLLQKGFCCPSRSPSLQHANPEETPIL